MSRVLTLTTLAVSSLALLVSGYTAVQLHRSQSTERVITARGLVIQDGSGQARVVLGAPLPDPLSEGVSQGPRASPLSGVVLLGAGSVALTMGAVERVRLLPTCTSVLIFPAGSTTLASAAPKSSSSSTSVMIATNAAIFLLRLSKSSGVAVAPDKESTISWRRIPNRPPRGSSKWTVEQFDNLVEVNLILRA